MEERQEQYRIVEPDRLRRVSPDDAEYRRLAAAEMDFWSRPHPFGLESLEKVESPGPAERYNNERLTGRAGVPWYEVIPRYGPFRRGLILGTSALGVEARILETNPSLHVTFLDISPGAVARRAEVLGARFPGRVATAVGDLNFITLEPESYDFIASSATLHHVINVEYLAYQINRALTGDGRFFLQDYVGEPRFDFSEQKRRVFNLLHDRELAARQPWRKASIIFDEPNDLSPFCGVRSDELLGVLGTYLYPVEVRTAGTLLVALMRAHPTDLASFATTRSHLGWRAAFWLERRAYSLVGRLPPRNTLMPDRFLRTLGEIGDLLADAGLLTPGLAFGIYRKR